MSVGKSCVTAADDPNRAFLIGGTIERPTLQFSSNPYQVAERLKVNNVRFVVEPTADEYEAPRMIEGAGVVKVHHAQFKATIYYDLLRSDHTLRPQVAEVYFDMDDLHQVAREELGGP